MAKTPTPTPDHIWQALDTHYTAIKSRTLRQNFIQDPARFAKFSAQTDGIFYDYSKTSMDSTAKTLLLDLLHANDFTQKRADMFQGIKINKTEDRAVLHTALRTFGDTPIMVNNADIMPALNSARDTLFAFADSIRSGAITAANKTPFTDIISIGIGGSDLGPSMVTRALAPYHDGPRVHFVANVDGADISDTLTRCNPAQTLVMIASKTFGTVETLTNADTARRWLQADLGDDFGTHLVAMSSDYERTRDFGIAADRVFPFADWVGGRLSVWGPIGLAIIIAIGAKRFRDFLDGAAQMDSHFQSAELADNLPVLQGIVGLWHRNVCRYPARAILPYEHRLARLPAYLQQLDMESNGKSVTMDGVALKRPTVPLVWGEVGTNGQHAFYQMLHQGTDVIPCEFLVARQGHEAGLVHQHQMLQANCLAQAEALMCGREKSVVRGMMRDAGLTGEACETQAAHRDFDGNRPSTMVIYPKLTPRVLGQMMAMYEHRVFVEGVAWGVNSFDQWGVELGKTMATEMVGFVQAGAAGAGTDGSTAGLIEVIAKGAG